MANVKETLELLDGLKVIAEVGAEIFEDGKIKLDDLSKLTKLGDSFGVLSEAVKGLDAVDDEIKDLTITEITQLLAKVYEIVLVFKKEEEPVVEEPTIDEEPVINPT